MDAIIERLEAGETLAEIEEVPAEIGAALLELAGGELEAGRVEAARTILEGLVVTNPRDEAGWALLSRAHRRQGQPLAARFCAEVALQLAPEDPHVRLAHAESLLCFPEDREEARAALAALAGAGDGVGERARALAAALAG
jgi:tetratricopeptide (TPR) repeat protein